MKHYNKIIFIMIVAAICLQPFPRIFAGNYPATPVAIQGNIMDVGQNYIIVAEKRIALVNSNPQTRISNNGIECGKDDLRKGVTVFAKCYRDKNEGFIASDIFIIKHILGENDNKERLRLMND